MTTTIHGETVAPVYECKEFGFAVMHARDGSIQFAAIDPKVYIIFSADFMRHGVNTMNFMDPTHHKGTAEDSRYHMPFPEFELTEEDDDGNEYDYLVDEVGQEQCHCDGGAGKDRGFKWRDHGGSITRKDENFNGEPVKLEPGHLYQETYYGWGVAEPCEYCGGTGNYAERYRGPHRKWVGELDWDAWVRFAERYCIELDDDGMPEHYDETMGSLTEFGLLPAICIDNTEGWNSGMDDGGVIDSHFYCTFLRWHLLSIDN